MTTKSREYIGASIVGVSLLAMFALIENATLAAALCLIPAFIGAKIYGAFQEEK